MKIIGPLPLAFFHHSRPEKGPSFVGSSTYEIFLKTKIVSCWVRKNDLHATTLQSDEIRAKMSIKLLQEKLLTRIIFSVKYRFFCGIIPPAKKILFAEP